MRRREFIAGIGSAAVWPRAASAQQRGMPIVGHLNAQSSTAVGIARYLAAFQQGLREAGYVEGRNVAIEYRWAEGHFDRLPGLAVELIGRSVAVIVATGSDTATRAAKAATTTVPIVFVTGGDPVQNGLVASLNRPGGNLTGVTNLFVELSQKSLELMHQLLPTATDLAFLVNPNSPNVETMLRETQLAARILGVQLHILRAGTERDVEEAFANWAHLGAGPLVISGDPYFIGQCERLAALALRFAIPAIFNERDYVAAGGLMSYGSDNRDMYRLVGGYTGRILKGEKPADLPVQQATKIVLIINMKTAKTLGLTVPQSILLRADEVIE